MNPHSTAWTAAVGVSPAPEARAVSINARHASDGGCVTAAPSDGRVSPGMSPRWRCDTTPVMPLTRTGLFATSVFTFVFVWNDFLFALVLTRTEVITYTVQVTHYFGGQSNFWAKISAMSVLGTLPVFFTVATMQRYMVRGISMGAVKG